MKKTIILLSAVAALCSCGASQKESSAAAESVKTVAAKVKTEIATVQTVRYDQIYSSTVKAFAVNNIAPQAGGRIEAVKTEVGQFVNKGQVLAEMEDLQLVQAKIKYANDENEYQRIKALYEQGGVSKSDFDQIEMGIKVSKAQLENLERNTYLRSPIAGVVSARNYDQGDMYTMAQPLFTVQQIVPVKMLVAISEADYSKVKVGIPVEVTADALPGKTYTGKVVRIHPTIDAMSHTFAVEVSVPNNNRELRPGMFVRTKVNLGSGSNIVVPDMCVVKQQGSGQRFVFVVKDGVAVQKAVELGVHFGDRYEILSGLEEGEKIITKGAATLKDGSKVEEI